MYHRLKFNWINHLYTSFYSLLFILQLNLWAAYLRLVSRTQYGHIFMDNFLFFHSHVIGHYHLSCYINIGANKKGKLSCKENASFVILIEQHNSSTNPFCILSCLSAYFSRKCECTLSSILIGCRTRQMASRVYILSLFLEICQGKHSNQKFTSFYPTTHTKPNIGYCLFQAIRSTSYLMKHFTRY